MLKNKKVTIETITECLYLLAIFIYSIGRVFRSSLIIDFSSNTTRTIYLITIILCLPKILISRYSKKELLISVLIVLTGIIAFLFFPRKRDLLAIPIVLIGVKNSDIKTIVRIVFVTCMFFVILHTSAYFIDHFMKGGTIFNIPFFDRSETRSTVLCKYYNDYGAITSMTTMQYLYLTNRDKDRYLKFWLLLLISFFIYAIGTSRTSFIISVFVLLYLPLETNRLFKSKLHISKIITFIVVVVLSFSFFHVDLDNSMVIIANKLLTGRIHISQYGYEALGLSLLPQVDKIASNTLGFDLFVVYMVLSYGLLITGAILCLTAYLCVFKKQDSYIDYLTIILFIWALSGRFNYYVTLTIVPMIVMNHYYRKQNQGV